MTFEMNNSSRGAGRGRGGRGPGRGFSRGGFGDRGRGFRGGRGGDRGGRGSFRGGDRGTARRGSFGPFAQTATRGGRNDRINGGGEETPVCHEIAHGLQLRICYKSDIPSEEEITKQIPGFHSRFTKSNDTKAHFLLFKDIESLEAAKKKLDNDDSLDSVDYMGLKSARNQTAAKESRQLFLNFSSPQEEETVKKLDSKILSVEFLKDKTSCLAEFATSEEANSALKTILDSKDRGDLKIARESHALKLNNFAQTTIQPKLIVLRDVPKKTTLKDLAPLFPDATSVTIFSQTFPSSEYCHASLRFEDTERVKEILSSSKVHKILGKKIFVGPAYSCLLIEMPKLGEAWTGDQKTAVKSTETKDNKASPNKKIKLENAASEEEDDDDEDEEEEEDDDDEEEESEKEEGKEGNDQNVGSGEEDDEDDAEEEESDDE